MTIRAVLFDKDGTILDYDLTWGPINRRVAEFAAGGDPVRADELMSLGGYDLATGTLQSGSVLACGTNVEIADAFARHLGDEAPEGLHGMVEQLFTDGGARSVIVPGCKTALEQLIEAGLVLGVATNDSSEGLKQSLAPHGILDAFSFLAGYDSGFAGKPSPDMVLGFCEAVDLPPSAVAIIGDNEHDMEAGRRAGVGLKVGVLTGTSRRQELIPHADIVLASVAELPECTIPATAKRKKAPS